MIIRGRKQNTQERHGTLILTVIDDDDDGEIEVEIPKVLARPVTLVPDRTLLVIDATDPKPFDFPKAIKIYEA